MSKRWSNFKPYLKGEIHYLRSLKITFLDLLKWSFIVLLIGAISGSASALFLISLDWVTSCRTQHSTLIYFLPAAGLCIGLAYHYFGKESSKGNALLFKSIHGSEEKLPRLMAPLIYISTLVTHLFGGSAGREGTALQMSASLMDQFSGVLKLNETERKVLLCSAIAAGFGSVFGTPLAGIIFSLELFAKGRLRYHAALPILFSALVAHEITNMYGVIHTHYAVSSDITWKMLPWSLPAGIGFGLCAALFTYTMHGASTFFNSLISYPPLRPLIGGVILVVIALSFPSSDYLGLGIPVIQSAFESPSIASVFLIKILFTVITLSSGFKGGEVTPLFFIGATLGSAMSAIIPLPVSLLAGMGFVAVFAGATHAPFACLIMGMELFGFEYGVWMAIACIVAYWVSGTKSIYSHK